MQGLIDILWRIARLSLVLLAVYGVVTLAAYFLQDSLLFFPQPLATSSLTNPDLPDHRVEPVTVEAEDGTQLRGWFLRNKNESLAPVLIYFGGNAEELSWQMGPMGALSDLHILLINYRGYGESEGRPTEKALLADALSIYDSAIGRPEVDSSQVILMGRSLGTGVSTYLAAQRPVAGVILISPFDSMVSVARRHFGYLPVNALLRNRFDSVRWAPDINVPVLMITGVYDRTIPEDLSRRLAKQWKGPVTWESIDGRDHNSLLAYAQDWSAIHRFIAEILD